MSETFPKRPNSWTFDVGTAEDISETSLIEVADVLTMESRGDVWHIIFAGTTLTLYTRNIRTRHKDSSFNIILKNHIHLSIVHEGDLEPEVAKAVSAFIAAIAKRIRLESFTFIERKKRWLKATFKFGSKGTTFEATSNIFEGPVNGAIENFKLAIDSYQKEQEIA